MSKCSIFALVWGMTTGQVW